MCHISLRLAKRTISGPDAARMTDNRTYIWTLGSTSERGDIVRHVDIERGSGGISVLGGRAALTTSARKQMTALRSGSFSYFRPSTVLIIEISWYRFDRGGKVV
jgi:hypothetical protein